MMLLTMNQAINFIISHWVLVSIFISLLTLLIITELKRGGPSLSPQAAVLLINQKNAIVLDIRDAKEFAKAHIVNAINIPYSQLTNRHAELEKYKDQPIIIVCSMGQHTGAAAHQLIKQGFKETHKLSGGINAWRADSLPLVKS